MQTQMVIYFVLNCFREPWNCHIPIVVSHNGRGPGAIAIDCEMVGGGDDGTLDLCALVCLIDEDENVIFHTYVRPQIPVTNFRYLYALYRPRFL